MAKKKSMDKNIWYGLGVLVIIIAIVVVLQMGDKPAEDMDDSDDMVDDTPVTVTPVEDDEPEEPEDTSRPADEAEGPSMEVLECDEGVTLGYMPGSCMELADGSFEVGIKNSGRGDLEGMWYYMYDGDDNLVGEDSEMVALAIGEDNTFTIPMGKFEGSNKFEIIPITKVDGKTSICANKKLLVPLSSCS